MKHLCLIFSLVCTLLTGCAGLNFDAPKRWVSNNTLYSNKSPSVQIEVDNSYIYQEGKTNNRVVTADNRSYSGGLDTEWFYFTASDKSAKIDVKIETISNGTRLYMMLPNFSNVGNIFSTRQEKFNGMNFQTVIFSPKANTTPVLIKAFAKVINDQTGLQLYYIEKVDEDWSVKNTVYLKSAEQDFLSRFSLRADQSFDISSFDPKSEATMQPPLKKTTD